KNVLGDRINTQDEVHEMDEGSKVVIGGEVSTMKRHRIKRGKNQGKYMGFATITYAGNSWDCTFFKDRFEKYEDILKDGNVLLLKGKKGENGEILADSCIEIERLLEAIK